MRKEKIGKSTLYLGDCLDILPEISKVDSVVCDPPYGMAFQSNYREIKHLKIENDDNPDIAKLVIDWALAKAKHSLYAFGRWDNIIDYPKPKSLITWVKNNWSMGDLEHEHARQTEVIFFYNLVNHSFPYKRPTDVVYFERTKNEYHPTEKPVGLMQTILGWTSGTVLDPLMGGGSTGIACAKMDREFIGIEKELKYFDIACKRIEDAQRQTELFI